MSIEARESSCCARPAIAAILWLLLAGAVPGQIHVSSQRGADDNEGTVARPFRTIQRAVDEAALRPGHDTVILMPSRVPYTGGVYIEDHSGGVTLRGLGSPVFPPVVDGGSIGLEVAFSDPVRIERLRVRSARDGILVLLSTVRLVDVHCVGNSRHGMDLLGGEVEIEGGSFSENGLDGIHSDFYSNPPIAMHGVDLRENGANGLFAFGTVVRAQDCAFVANPGYGIDVRECYVELLDSEIAANGVGARLSAIGSMRRCAIERNGADGIAVLLGTLLVEDCDIRDNDGNGIVASHLGSLAVWRTRVRENGGDGLRIADQHVEIRDSSIAFNLGNGVTDLAPRTWWGRPPVRISNSKICRNEGCGFLGWVGSPPILVGVRFFGNALGDLLLR